MTFKANGPPLMSCKGKCLYQEEGLESFQEQCHSQLYSLHSVTESSQQRYLHLLGTASTNKQHTATFFVFFVARIAVYHIPVTSASLVGGARAF